MTKTTKSKKLVAAAALSLLLLAGPLAGTADAAGAVPHHGSTLWCWLHPKLC